MSYRKLKKQYMKRFHVALKIDYFDMSGKKLGRLSKKATAWHMKIALLGDEPFFGVDAE